MLNNITIDGEKAKYTEIPIQGFFAGVMDLNTEMRKILNERNVSLQILSSKGCRQWYNT